MGLTIIYNKDSTLSVTCGPESITIGVPGKEITALPPPVSTGGDGVIAAIRKIRRDVRVELGEDPAMLLHALVGETASEVFLTLASGVSDPLDVGDILKAAKTTFGDSVKVFFTQEAHDG